MLRKVLKVIGIGFIGLVIASGALAVSVVYIIPEMLAYESEQKITVNSISCPPGMIENIGTGQCGASNEIMVKVAIALAQIEDTLSHRIDHDPVFLRQMVQSI